MITRRIYNPKPQTILLAAIKVDKKKEKQIYFFSFPQSPKLNQAMYSNN